MASFKLSDNAREDLTRLYFYGLERFGERQADAYYNKLFDHFELISEHPLSYPSAETLRSGYRKCVCESDSIYYRILGEQVEIMAIISQQDLDSWL